MKGCVMRAGRLRTFHIDTSTLTSWYTGSESEVVVQQCQLCFRSKPTSSAGLRLRSLPALIRHLKGKKHSLSPEEYYRAALWEPTVESCKVYTIDE
jgi:hypothetical protein